MGNIKTKSIEKLEQRMQEMPESSLRHRVLQCAKEFKTSWIDLGQALYAVWKDKLFRDWGYSSFEIYASKEIGIRKETAVKLLKSYIFLEKKEPFYLQKAYKEEANVATLPSYEAVNVLRLASNKKMLDEVDYTTLKEDVFQKGKDVRDIKKGLTALIRERQDVDPEDARSKRRTTLIKRFLGTLKSLRTEIKISKMLPIQLIKDTEKLISNLEAEIS